VQIGFASSGASLLSFVGAIRLRLVGAGARYDRRMYRALAILWLLGWAMFSVPWSSFTTRPRMEQINLVPFSNARRADQIRNFVYYLPAGALGIGIGLSPVTVVTAAAGLSAVAEATQVFSAGRFPSATDLMLNTAGALVGAAIALAARARARGEHPLTSRSP
jgi:VanZ family protein